MESEQVGAKTNAKRRGVGRLLSLGTGGLSAAVALLMILSPASAAAVHPHLIMAAPYIGTVASGNSYNSINGCATGSTAPLKWNATSGKITGSNKASATTCLKVLGSVGGYSGAYEGAGIDVAIPFKVSTSGNHTIAAAFTATLASTLGATHGACAKGTVNYHPPLYSYSSSYCEAGGFVDLFIEAQVQDLNNNSWYSNFSYFENYTEKVWENFTDCYNYGTPTCYNNTGWFNFSGGFGYNAKGSLSLSGSGAATLWSNGTNMVAGHHYVLVLYVNINSEGFADQFNLKAHFNGSGKGSVNMGGATNGANVASVTVV